MSYNENTTTTPTDDITQSSTPHHLFFRYVEGLSFDKLCSDRLHIRERRKKGDKRPSDGHSLDLLDYFIEQKL